MPAITPAAAPAATPAAAPLNHDYPRYPDRGYPSRGNNHRPVKLATLELSGHEGRRTFDAWSYDLNRRFNYYGDAFRAARDRARHADYNQAQAIVHGRDGAYWVGTLNTPSGASHTGWQGLMIDGSYFNRRYDSARAWRENDALRAIVGASREIEW